MATLGQIKLQQATKNAATTIAAIQAATTPPEKPEDKTKKAQEVSPVPKR